MRKIFIVLMLIVIFMLFGMNSLVMGQQTYRYSMGTGSLGGSMYIMGAGLTSIWSKEIPELSVSVESTGGAPANINLMSRQRIELGLFDNGPLALAYNGLGDFEKHKEAAQKFRTIYTWPKAGFQVIVDGESDLKKIEDLKGKKISIGARGSSSAALVPIILEICGVKEEDSQFRYLSSTDAVDQLRNRTIDALVFTTLPPMMAVSNLVMTRKIRLLEITGEALQTTIDKIPGSYSVVIQPDVYGENQVNEEQIESIGYGGSLIVVEEMDEDFVYRMTKTIWENLDEFHKVSPMCSRLTKDNFLTAKVVPLHPGAERYYKEVGMLK